MTRLVDRTCEPCRTGTPALAPAARDHLLAELAGWEVVAGHHLRKVYTLPDFAGALALVNRIGEVAEAEQHHPDLELSWGRVVVELHTHAAAGLTENDFILAAKIDRALGD